MTQETPIQTLDEKATTERHEEILAGLANERPHCRIRDAHGYERRWSYGPAYSPIIMSSGDHSPLCKCAECSGNPAALREITAPASKRGMVRTLATVAALALASFAHGQNIPDAPQPIISAATRSAMVLPFAADRFNRALMAGDMAARLTDAFSTVTLTEGPHPVGRETLLPARLAKSGPGMAAYSVAVSLGLDWAAAHEWRHGHRKVARWLLIADTAQDGACAGHNLWILTHHRESSAAGFSVHP